MSLSKVKDGLIFCKKIDLFSFDNIVNQPMIITTSISFKGIGGRFLSE